MSYFFLFDFTFSSISYINIYIYQHEYLYLYNNYNIIYDIFPYINIIFFEYHIFDYLFLNFSLNLLLYQHLTLTKFSCILLYLNNFVFKTSFLIFFTNILVLLFDSEKLAKDICKNLVIYILYPNSKNTLFPIWVYFNEFYYIYNYIYNSLYNYNNLIFFSLFWNWLYYLFLEFISKIYISWWWFFFLEYIYIFLFFFIFFYIFYFYIYISYNLKQFSQINYFYIHILFFDKLYKEKFFLYSIFYNPLYLYLKKNEKISNNLWIEIYNKNQVNKFKNDDFDLIYIYIYDVIKDSYKKYIILLQFTLIGRIFFFFFFFFFLLFFLLFFLFIFKKKWKNI